MFCVCYKTEHGDKIKNTNWWQNENNSTPYLHRKHLFLTVQLEKRRTINCHHRMFLFQASGSPWKTFFIRNVLDCYRMFQTIDDRPRIYFFTCSQMYLLRITFRSFTLFNYKKIQHKKKLSSKQWMLKI